MINLLKPNDVFIHRTSEKAFLLFINHTKPKTKTRRDKQNVHKNQGQSGSSPHKTTLRASSTKVAMGLTRQKNRKFVGTALMG